MRAIPSEGLLNLKNVSHSITAEIDVSEGGGNGVLLSQGGVQNGWALYLRDGKLKYGYNLATLKQTLVEAADPVPAGVHQVRMEFAYDGGGLGKGAGISLFIDGTKTADGRLDITFRSPSATRQEVKSDATQDQRSCRTTRQAQPSTAPSTGSRLKPAMTTTTTYHPRTAPRGQPRPALTVAADCAPEAPAAGVRPLPRR